MDDIDSIDSSICSSSNMAAAASSLSAKSKPFSQGQLSDLVRDLGLSKESFEILASCFCEHGILDSETKITFYRDGDYLLIRFFTMEDHFVQKFLFLLACLTANSGHCSLFLLKF